MNQDLLLLWTVDRRAIGKSKSRECIDCRMAVELARALDKPAAHPRRRATPLLRFS